MKNRYNEAGKSRRRNATRTQGGEPVGRLNFKNAAQAAAWEVYKRHDVTFLIGPAGSGKSFLATAFALKDLFADRGPGGKRLVLTRPIVEAGENLGFLPGTLEEKVDPYMLPLFDCLDQLLGRSSSDRDEVKARTEVAPLAYMRGRTLANTIAILDEAQNCTLGQIRLFLSRLGEGGKMIITGDPHQSDLFGVNKTPLMQVVERLSSIEGIGVVRFTAAEIVRHPVVGRILGALEGV